MHSLDQRSLAALVRTAARPASTERESLDLLRLRTWPGDGERLDPAGIRRLLRVGPQRAGTRPPRCGCAGGRCAICG